MNELLDSIKEIENVPLFIPIAALVILAIGLLIVIRTKKKQSAIEDRSDETYSSPKTTHELTSYVKGKLVALLEHIDQEAFKEHYEIVDRYLKTIEENYLLVLFGEYNAGKSSFINAFLGEEILATGITPTTVTINKISYGEAAKQEIVFHDEAHEVVSDDGALSQYLTDEERLREIAYIRTFYPSNKLDNIDVIDTPGLNSLFTYHEEAALNFVNKADAVLWLFHPQQGGSESEKEYLAKIKEYGKSIIGVVSHKDSVKADKDIALLTDFIRDNFGEFFDQVFAVSSRQALQSIKSGDQSGYKDSGLGEIEEYLTQRIFDRIRRAKLESAIASCKESASHVCTVMSDKEVSHRVLSSVGFYFTELREFARRKIEKIFSLKEIFYALVFRKGKVRFLINEEFLGMLDKRSLELSIMAIVDDLKRRANESFKKVEMELMIENEKRRKHGKRLLGDGKIGQGPPILDDSTVNNIVKCGEIFNEEDISKVISTRLSFKELYERMGGSIREAKEELERNVSAYISERERSYVAWMLDGLIKMNRKINNGLVEQSARYVLDGAKDAGEFRDAISSLESKIRIIDDIAVDLEGLRIR
jgi:GTPase SAR1 family protein